MRNVFVNLNSNCQIEVQVGTEFRVGESYYLGLQADDEGSGDHPVEGTHQLVSEWIRLLTELDDGAQLFLPFDFSDEFTRWLTMHRDGRDVTIVFGWATIEGWSIPTRDLSLYAHGVPGFVPDEPLYTQTFYLPRVLSNLRHSLALLAAEVERGKAHCQRNGQLQS